MSLAQSQYAVAENDILMVNIILDGMVSEDVTVEVNISDGTAKGNLGQ